MALHGSFVGPQLEPIRERTESGLSSTQDFAIAPSFQNLNALTEQTTSLVSDVGNPSSGYPNGIVTSAIIHISGVAATKIDLLSLENFQNNALYNSDSSEPSQVKSQSAVTNPRPLSTLRYSATVGSKLSEFEPGSTQPTEIKLGRIDLLEHNDRESTGDQSLPLEGSESKSSKKKRKTSVSGAPAPLIRLCNAMLQEPVHRSSISHATPIAELLVLEHTVRAGSLGASSLSVVKDVHGLLFRLIREKKTHIASCIMRKHILNLNARDKEVSTLFIFYHLSLFMLISS